MLYLCIKLIFKEFLIFKILKTLIYKFLFLFSTYVYFTIKSIYLKKSHNLI